MIFIADGRGKFEVENYTDDDGTGILINHTAAYPATNHLALDADEARQLAAVLIKFADEQDGNDTHGV
jgi:hypothetical protein